MNVVLYVIDALRADHLSCYGYRRQTSPHIDVLAEEAVLFEQAFAVATWTRASAGSILTSTYPSVHGAIDSASPFRPTVPTLAETLRERGFHTAGLSAIANVSSLLGFSRGFDAFFDLYKEPGLVAKREVIEINRHAGPVGGETTRLVTPLAEDANEYAFSWLEKEGFSQRNGAPFFLFIWVIDPHNPYRPPEGFNRFADPAYRGRIDGSLDSIRAARTAEDISRLIDLYDGEIYYTDHCFGRLCAKLRGLGLWDDTLLILTSDHGQAFGEHGIVLHAQAAYDELLRVPLLIKPPRGRTLPRRRIPEMVSSLDIVPTVLDLIGLKDVPERAAYQGRSLLPLLDSPGEIHDYVYSECRPSAAGAYFASIRSPEWKFIFTEPPSAGRSWLRTLGRLLRNRYLLADLIRHPAFYWKRQVALQRELLFHLSKDPEERTDVKAIYPEKAAELRQKLLDWRENNRLLARQGPGYGESLTLDEDTLRQLRGLGYL